jgi:hypothetical protein
MICHPKYTGHQVQPDFRVGGKIQIDLIGPDCGRLDTKSQGDALFQASRLSRTAPAGCQMYPILKIGCPKCSLLQRSIWVILSTAKGRNKLNKKSPAQHHFLLPKERIKQ